MSSTTCEIHQQFRHYNNAQTINQDASPTETSYITQLCVIDDVVYELDEVTSS